MKTNMIRKASVLLLVAMLLVPRLVIAAEDENQVCTTHKNYYLYLLPVDVPSYANEVYNSEQNKLQANFGAYFPMLPSNALPAVNNRTFISGRICLSKSGVTDGNYNQCTSTWTVEDYYRIQAKIVRNFDHITFKDEKGIEHTTGVYEEEVAKENGNRVIEHYYGGAQWFKCTDDDCNNETNGVGGTDTTSLSIETLAKGTILPSLSIISFNPESSSRVVIKRTIDIKDFLDYIEYDEDENPKTENGSLVINSNPTKVVPFVRPGGSETILLAPAVYYVEYQTCENSYTATINYYYYIDDKPTDEPVDFDDDSDNPFVKTGLIAGESVTHNSPSLKGCTIVNKDGKRYDADKRVTITIDENNPKDESKNVYYHCSALDSGEQEPTGDFLIYLAWAIGLGAIGYSVYYFKNLKKEEI